MIIIFLARKKGIIENRKQMSVIGLSCLFFVLHMRTK